MKLPTHLKVLALDLATQTGFVRFARGYTSTTAEFTVTHIDIGPCLLPGHEGQRIRIHFTETQP